ncbi:MAG: hypothetical protein LUD50_03060, partial [Clostridia bacterium]|nr:hypothetical protein [Clostridia bacterium]
TGPLTTITVSTENKSGLLLTKSDVSGITIVNDETGESYYCVSYTEIEGVGLEYPLSYELTLNAAINTTGSYTLTIPADYFDGTSDETNDDISNAETVVGFNLTAGTEVEQFTFDHANGSILPELSVIEIISATGYLAPVAENSEDKITVRDANGTTYSVASVVIAPDSYVCTITLSESVTTAGTCTVTIPAGFFYVNEAETVTNAAVTVSYTIREITAAPSDGSTINGELTAVVLSSNVEFEPTSGDYESFDGITTTNGEITSISYGDEPGEDGNYTCTLTIAGTTLGECVITIPAEFFTYQPEQITLIYGIVPENSGIEFTFDPADGGGVMGTMYQFDITANCWLERADISMDAITITDEKGDVVATGNPSRQIYWDYQTADVSTGTIYITPALSDLGAYTIHIPAGFFYTDEEHNGLSPELTSTFNIVEFTFNPADGDEVSSLDNIIISCGDTYFGIEDDHEASEVILYLFGRDLTEATYCESITGIGDPNEDGWYLSYNLHLAEPVTAEGTYILLIPEGFFTYQSEDLEPAWVVDGSEAETANSHSFGSTTGINGINANGDGDSVEIYNTAGQKVTSPVNGTIKIVRKADGTIRKVLVK